MAIERIKRISKEKDETIDKEIDASVEPARRLPRNSPPPEKADPRSHTQPSKQRHPPRPPGP